MKKVGEPILTPDGTVAAGLFKARCLELMDQVRDSGREIVITKHGKPVAKLVPVRSPYGGEKPTSLKGTITILGDIIAPVDEEW